MHEFWCQNAPKNTFFFLANLQRGIHHTASLGDFGMVVLPCREIIIGRGSRMRLMRAFLILCPSTKGHGLDGGYPTLLHAGMSTSPPAEQMRDRQKGTEGEGMRGENVSPLLLPIRLNREEGETFSLCHEQVKSVYTG